MCAVTELIRQRVLTLLIFIRDLMEDVQSLIDTAGDTEAIYKHTCTPTTTCSLERRA